MPSDPVRQPSAAPSSVWVKICGVRDLATLRQVIAAGAQAVGLNFYAASPRSVTVDVAHALSREAADEIERVGLFVNHPVEWVLATPTIGLVKSPSPKPTARSIARLGLRATPAVISFERQFSAIGVVLFRCRVLHGRVRA